MFKMRPSFDAVPSANPERRIGAKKILVYTLYLLMSCATQYRVLGMIGQITTSPVGRVSAGGPGRRLIPTDAAASAGPAHTLGWTPGRSPPQVAIESRLAHAAATARRIDRHRRGNSKKEVNCREIESDPR